VCGQQEERPANRVCCCLKSSSPHYADVSHDLGAFQRGAWCVRVRVCWGGGRQGVAAVRRSDDVNRSWQQLRQSQSADLTLTHIASHHQPTMQPAWTCKRSIAHDTQCAPHPGTHCRGCCLRAHLSCTLRQVGVRPACVGAGGLPPCCW
jgi:hypothetical protein